MTDPEFEALRNSISRVIDSASHLGVELDQTEAQAWIDAMKAESQGTDIVVDVDTGVFGHRASMLDLDPADLAHFRRMAPIVGFENRTGVKTALALSGSSAQSRIQAYPADADFFERIHITAPTREEACRILGDLIRDKALTTMVGPTHRLMEVKLGTWDAEVTKDGKTQHKGNPIAWTPPEVEVGRDERGVGRWVGAERPVGGRGAEPRLVQARLGRRRPGARPAVQREQRARSDVGRRPTATSCRSTASWIPYFQEVYIDTDARPLFDRLIKDLSTDAVDDYVKQLEHECWKYSVKDPELGQGRAAAVQHLPADRPLRRGRVHQGAVRRADDRAVPAGGTDPDPRRRGLGRLTVRIGGAGGPDRSADHVGDQRHGGPAGSPGGLAAAQAA